MEVDVGDVVQARESLCRMQAQAPSKEDVNALVGVWLQEPLASRGSRTHTGGTPAKTLRMHHPCHSNQFSSRLSQHACTRLGF